MTTAYRSSKNLLRGSRHCTLDAAVDPLHDARFVERVRADTPQELLGFTAQVSPHRHVVVQGALLLSLHRAVECACDTEDTQALRGWHCLRSFGPAQHTTNKFA